MSERERVRLEDVRSPELLDCSVRALFSGWVDDV